MEGGVVAAPPRERTGQLFARTPIRGVQPQCPAQLDDRFVASRKDHPETATWASFALYGDPAVRLAKAPTQRSPSRAT